MRTGPSKLSHRDAELLRRAVTGDELVDSILDEFALPDEVEEAAASAAEASSASAAAAAAEAAAAAAAAAPPPDGLEYVSGCCYGCGARLQVSAAGVAGFVERARYAEKRAHRQQGQVLCARCSGLAHGVLLNGVAGQGRATGAAGRASWLATPDELRAHLTALRDRKVLVVLLVDALDFSGSFLPRLRDATGSNPVLLVVTKADLLPRGTDTADFASWVEDEVGHRRLSLVGLHLVSSRTGDGVAPAVADMRSLRKGRDVVVVGAANVGKSTFVRAALGAMRAAGDLAAPSSRLPVASVLPGTTLGCIPLRAFSGQGVLWDTPGVVLHHRVNGLLDPASLAAIAPRARLVQLEAVGGVAPGMSVLLEGLLRVDVVACPPATRLLFFGPTSDARLATMPTHALDADGPAAAWGGASPGPLGADEVASRGGLRVARDFELSPGTKPAPIADLCLSGLGGWMAVVAGGGRAGSVRLRVWAPPGAEVFLRPPLPAWPRGEW